ncbi:hypothetical protein MRX96_029429 [Rhipicephalus microplus]
MRAPTTLLRRMGVLCDAEGAVTRIDSAEEPRLYSEELTCADLCGQSPALRKTRDAETLVDFANTRGCLAHSMQSRLTVQLREPDVHLFKHKKMHKTPKVDRNESADGHTVVLPEQSPCPALIERGGGEGGVLLINHDVATSSCPHDAPLDRPPSYISHTFSSPNPTQHSRKPHVFSLHPTFVVDWGAPSSFSLELSFVNAARWLGELHGRAALMHTTKVQAAGLSLKTHSFVKEIGAGVPPSRLHRRRTSILLCSFGRSPSSFHRRRCPNTPLGLSFSTGSHASVSGYGGYSVA